MAEIQSIVAYLLAHQSLILGVLFGLSEALSFIPSIEANGVFQGIYNFLKAHKPAA